ncbi:hypothetical protein VT930_18865 [Mycobacterium sherrisii]|uniref:hypothetical protein n=1 Tax=Mycobacterium sherrisii TaxID=243061 RepID=UPI002DDD23EA|nr:hypothetical protein [Mycobacterium sherrisii]MEC4765144.1 hypothetical protein [Mycobacterium sherrisii]
MLADVLTAGEHQAPVVTPDWIQAQAAAVIETVSKSRTTWQRNHVFAEAQRRVRAQGAGFDLQVAVVITDAALREPYSVEHRDPDANILEPPIEQQPYRQRAPKSGMG